MFYKQKSPSVPVGLGPMRTSQHLLSVVTVQKRTQNQGGRQLLNMPGPADLGWHVLEARALPLPEAHFPPHLMLITCIFLFLTYLEFRLVTILVPQSQ